MKRILFINLRSHYIERMEPLYAARNLNVKVTLMADKKPDIQDGFVDDYIITDTYDMTTCLEKVLAYNAEKEINGVVTWADKDVELVALIGEALGLKTLSHQASINARNKYKMRQQISEKFPELCPRYQLVRTYEDLKKAQADIGFPAVFKPVGASGSKSIFKIFDHHQLSEVYQIMKETTSIENDRVYTYFPSEYIYEELLLGDEISVEGIIHNGVIIVAGITDKKVTEDYSLEYKEIFPSQKKLSEQTQYRKQVEKALSSLLLDNCSFHAECKVNDGDLKVIEIAARPGGGFITSHLVPFVTGISFHEEVIKNALGEVILQDLDMTSWSIKPHPICGHLDILANQEGKIRAVTGIQEVFEDKRVKYFLPTKNVNERVVLPPKHFSSLYLATCIVQGSNLEEVESALDLIALKYKVEVE